VAGLSFFRVVDVDVWFEVKLRVETIIGEEGGKASHLGGVVIGSEFGYGEELGPVVLLVVDICLQVLFYDRIHLLCLPVCFWVEGHA
jgi:hypothetical protein